MSVVLRCPTCGTTQGHAGECEACSEGEVRYFCTNHDEGIWLDGPVCSRCGAKFGDPPRKPRLSRPPTDRSRPAGAPDFRPPARRRTPERPPEPDFGGAPTEALRTRRAWRSPRCCRGRRRWGNCSRRSPKRVLAPVAV